MNPDPEPTKMEKIGIRLHAFDLAKKSRPMMSDFIKNVDGSREERPQAEVRDELLAEAEHIERWLWEAT